jgi:hypothetical protein
MSLLDDIGDKLIADGVAGGVTGWTLYKSYQPDSPDKAVTILETGGPDPDQTPGIAHTFPTFQMRVRDSTFEYEAARTKIQEVFDSLNNATITGYVYVFAKDSGPILLRYDAADERPELVWNFRTMKA